MVIVNVVERVVLPLSKGTSNIVCCTGAYIIRRGRRWRVSYLPGITGKVQTQCRDGICRAYKAPSYVSFCFLFFFNFTSVALNSNAKWILHIICGVRQNHDEHGASKSILQSGRFRWAEDEEWLETQTEVLYMSTNLCVYKAISLQSVFFLPTPRLFCNAMFMKCSVGCFY